MRPSLRFLAVAIIGWAGIRAATLGMIPAAQLLAVKPTSATSGQVMATQFPEEFGAVVCFYGGGLAGEPRFRGFTKNTMEEAPKVKAPVLLFYGAIDQMITHDLVDRFTGRLKELAKGYQCFVYPGADHGFFCDERPSFNPAAASDAWEKSVAFLKNNLS